MVKWVKRVLDWIGQYQTIQSLIHAEFVRTALLPMVTAIVTGASGYFGGVPLMWVFVATALVFMAVMQALLRGAELSERKSPLNKLVLIGAHAAISLTPAPMPFPPQGNRAQRRAQGTTAPPQQPPMLSPAQCAPGVARTIDTVQLGVIVRNVATFPISVLLFSAESEVATLRPPRSAFPKAAILHSPGSTTFIHDDSIDMEEFPAQRLAGKLKLIIKYGLPGKEKYELKVDGDVDVVMENFGLVTQIGAQWNS